VSSSDVAIPTLLSPENVAEACGLSRRAVYRAIERGELRASRLCSRIRIRPDDVEAWVQENQIAPPPDGAARTRARALKSTDGLRRLLTESP
jgi:excisionase family DNA binding protein